jgi:hypothetical protein
MQKTSMTGPLGGSAGGPGDPTMNAKKRQWQPPLRSGAEGSGASTTQLEHIDGALPITPGGGSGLHPSSVSVL